jgi:hypothetical protein
MDSRRHKLVSMGRGLVPVDVGLSVGFDVGLGT